VEHRDQRKPRRDWSRVATLSKGCQTSEKKKTVRFAPLWSGIGLGPQQHRYPRDAQRRLPRYCIHGPKLAAKDGLSDEERRGGSNPQRDTVYLQRKCTAAKANQRALTTWNLVFVSEQGPCSSIPANATCNSAVQYPVGRPSDIGVLSVRHLQCMHYAEVSRGYW
jgi:hypothetical protein